MVTPAAVRRVAPVASREEAADRLYQALYGCTMHTGGVLHAVAAALAAEEAGAGFTLAEAAAVARDRAMEAGIGAPAEQAWRFDAMVAMCARLASSR
jgi:hypothetical protein